MAYTFIQSPSSFGTSPVSVTWLAAPTTGNLLLCAIENVTNATIPVVNDSVNGNWTQLAVESRSATQSIYLFGVIAGPSTTTTFTVTASGATLYADAHEFSGNPPTLTGIIDGSVGLGTGTATLNNSGSQPSVTTTNAGSLVMTIYGVGGTATSGSAFTSPFATNISNTPSAGPNMFTSYAMPGVTGTYNPSASYNNSRAWVQITIAFLPQNTLYLKSTGGNWSAAATWSAIGSGGTDSAGPPTNISDVILESGSGNLTIDVTSSCRSIDTTSGTGSYSGTITHSTAVTLNVGSSAPGLNNIALKFNTGMTYTLVNGTTSGIAFVSTTSVQQAIDLGSRTTGPVNFNGTGGSWILSSAFTTTSTGTVSLITGTLNTNNQTCTWGFFSGGGALSRSLILGSSSVTLIGASGTHWDFSTTPTNLTFTPGTSLITFNFTGTCTFQGGGQTFNNVVINFPGGLGFNYGGTNTFNNLTLNANGTFCPMPFVSGVTTTITGLLTISGNSVINRMRVISSIVGVAATVNAASTSLQNADFMDINAVGVGTQWTGTSLGDEQGNSGIIFTPAVTRYRVGSGGNWPSTANWSTTSGGLGGSTAPLAQDTVFVDSNATGAILMNNMTTNSPLCKDIDFTGFSGSFGGGLGNIGVYGNIKFSPTMIISPNVSLSFNGRGNQTITSNGNILTSNTTIQSPGGTYSLIDNLSVIGTLTLLIGTLTAGTSNVTCSNFAGGGTLVRTLNMGSGIWTVTGIGIVWTASNNLNLILNCQTSTIVISNTGGANKNFVSGGAPTYNNLTIMPGGTGDVTFVTNSGATFNVFNILGPKTVKFLAGYNLTCKYFYANGVDASNLVYLRSLINGIPWKLTLSTGYGVSFVDVQDSNAVTSIV